MPFAASSFGCVRPPRRRTAAAPWLAVMFALSGLAAASAAEPLKLHPQNPRLFEFRGEPTLLIGSGEHYGAVLNLDFDFAKYLAELEACGLNHTRTFSGVYAEPPGAFRIKRNTLAPAEGRLLAPWARSDEPGYAGGGNKFDLAKWDPAYFERLKAFLAEAGRRGVVVELTLFCPMYEDAMWRLSPMHPANHVNEAGPADRTRVYTLDQHAGLLPFQEALVRKLAAELNDFDNLYYEICNEPYFGGVTEDWQRRMTDVLAEAERELPRRHLISWNIANGSARVERPHPGVSVFNFHYAQPPDAVAQNWGLERPIGDNETGFRGVADAPYRREAWEFLLAGGALFSHLDYSFAAGFEDGTFEYPGTQPGGGNRGFRRQLRVLREFLESMDLANLAPAPDAIRGLPEGASARVLAAPGRQYAAYLRGRGPLKLRLSAPPGEYIAEWIGVQDGQAAATAEFTAGEDGAELTSPEFAEEIALRVKRME